MPTTNGKIYLGSTLISGGGTRLGAKILKTGQSTSFATGDDGDLQEGRDVDFFTLATNNPFGNANRFTALDGSQTYTNDIIVDWSTYEGSTVLAYYNGNLSAFANWAAALTWANELSEGGFTGWRLTNIKELANLCNYDLGIIGALRYAPFGRTANSHWSSTTTNNDTGAAYAVRGSDGIIGGGNKTTVTSNRAIACRNFTVTGTTLT
jgi:hypothetical protein